MHQGWQDWKNEGTKEKWAQFNSVSGYVSMLMIESVAGLL